MTATPAAVEVFHSPLLAQQSRLLHGFSGRGGGVSEGPYASLNLGPHSGDDIERVRENRRRFRSAVSVEDWAGLAPRQVHSAEVAVVRAADGLPAEGVLPGDGVVTDLPGVALSILAADCLPVLLYEPARGVIGAVHAGWRGTAGAIAGVAVRAMVEAFGCDPAQIVAALGPAIGRCCYEVGPEVLAAVGAVTPLAAELYEPLPAGKGLLDLVAANRAQLLQAGLLPANIDALHRCTACHTDRFFSHRREGEPTGRAGALIALRP